MVVRIHNVDKWKALQPGEFLELPGGDNRQVELDVNAPSPTRIDMLVGDVPTFLAVVQGYERIQFTASGLVELTFTSADELGSEVWYFTNDAGQGASENVMAASFTKLASRRTRNPQLELMMYKQEQNALRREEQLRDELTRAREAVANVASRAGGTGTETVVDPGPAGGTGESQPSPTDGSPAPKTAGTVDAAAVAT